MQVRLGNPPLITVETSTSSVVSIVKPQDTLRLAGDGTSPSIGPVVGPTPRGLQALGWRFFQDAQYLDTPLFCPAAVRTQIPDNGRGMLSTKAGANSDSWLKIGNGRLYPDAFGDFFFYRLNLTVKPTINNKTVLYDFDQGSVNKVWNRRVQLSTGAGIAVPDSFTAPVSCGSPMVQNGGAFFITPDCDVFVSRISILATKTFSLDPMS